MKWIPLLLAGMVAAAAGSPALAADAAEPVAVERTPSPPATSTPATTRAGKAVERTGEAIGRGTRKAQNAVGRGVRRTGAAAERGVKKTERATARGARKVGLPPANTPASAPGR